jgi:hypothetical protein
MECCLDAWLGIANDSFNVEAYLATVPDPIGTNPYGDSTHYQQRAGQKRLDALTTRVPVELITILRQEAAERNYPLEEASSAPSNEFYVSSVSVLFDTADN